MDETEMILIGAAAIYLLPKLSESIGNINTVVDTTTTAINNTTSAASWIVTAGLAPITGKNPFMQDQPSFWSSDYWTQGFNQLETDWKNIFE